MIGILTITGLLWGGLAPAAIGMHHDHAVLTGVGWSMISLAGIISAGWAALRTTIGQRPKPRPGPTTCQDCRFWGKTLDYPGEGACLLATQDMSLGEGKQPMMRAEAQEYYMSREDMLAHALGGGASATLLTMPGFTCAHANPRENVQ